MKPNRKNGGRAVKNAERATEEYSAYFDTSKTNP
jgi:hypothetical protein